MKIASPYRPYSHEAGIRIPIPYTTRVAVVYPTRVEVDGSPVDFPWTGPVKGFTAELDLEHGRIEVWGEAPEGYFRYRIEGEGERWELTHTRGIGSKPGSALSRPPLEKLSMGCHKKQDWERIRKRSDPAEYFPFWFAMGQQVEGGKLSASFEELKLIWQGCFDGLLSPRSRDTDYQGILQGKEFLPRDVLRGGYLAIRDLFVREGEEISLLPALPPEFHAGRLIGLKTSIGALDLEWAKKSLKKVGLTPDKEKVRIRFPKEIQSFRFDGQRRRSGEILIVEPGKKIVLDRME